MNRFWYAIVCAAIGGGLVWLVLGGSTDPAPLRRGAPGASGSSDGMPNSAAADWVDDAELDFDSEIERSDLDDVGAARMGPVLFVFDPGAGRAPVVDAEVFWVERDAAREAHGDQPMTHMAGLVVRYGDRLRTDENGRVQLPTIREVIAVAARSDTLFGFRVIGPRHGAEESLAMFPDQTLRLKVVDDAGVGVADVGVGVFQREDRRTRMRRRMRSDADGSVVLEHFQLHRRNVREPGSEFWAALLVPLAEPSFVRFRDDPLPTEELVLTLPATGSLAVRFTDPSGAPFANAGSVRLSVFGRPSRGWSPINSFYDSLRASKHNGQTVVEFARVGLGLDFNIETELDDDDFEWEIVEAGPTLEGERVEIEMSTPPWLGLLCGRLVMPDGTAVSGEAPTFLITSNAGRLEGEHLPLEPDGQFVLPFKVDEPKPPFALEIRHEPEEGPLADARIPLPELVVGRRTELGEIVLEPAPRIAYGRVVDDLGEPVEGAQIRMQLLRHVGGDPPRSQWRDEAFVDARASADGDYELWGSETHGGRSRLRFTARNHVSFETGDVVPGERVDVVLERTASLRGVTSAPGGLTRNSLTMRLVSAVDPELEHRARLRVRGETVRYRFNDVRPGVYDFVVHAAGFDDPIVTLAGLEIEPGPNELPPSLAALDLEDHLFRFRLRAVASDGTPITRLSSPLVANVVRPNGESVRVAFPWNNGRADFFSAAQQLELYLLGHGYRPREHTVLAGESDVVFDTVQPVELVLTGLRDAVGERRVRISTVLDRDVDIPLNLESVDQRSGRSRGYARAELGKSSGAWLGASDTVQVPLMHDGNYHVVVRIYGSGVREPQHRVMSTVPVRLSPHTSPRIEVPINLERVRDALRVLGEKQAAAQNGR